jgi:hypothetical protein
MWGTTGLSNSSSQAGYWSGSLPPGRKTDHQAEKTDRHAEKIKEKKKI